MIYLFMHRLSQSELGWFGEVRRLGRETARQRAINFETAQVARLFPDAPDDVPIPLVLVHRDDALALVSFGSVLRRQQKNWRITSDKVEARRFGTVKPGDLFLLALDLRSSPARGAFEVLDSADARAVALLEAAAVDPERWRGATGAFVAEAPGLASMLARLDPELFRFVQPTPASEPQAPGAPVTPSEPPGPEPSRVVRVHPAPPSPGRMFDAFANLGHTLPVAVAEILDNAIVARARNIEVSWPQTSPGEGCISIFDDGQGMDAGRLKEAMIFGSDREYAARDLGRFGIGLKSASLSQAGVVTVASRCNDTPVSVMRWDKEHVQSAKAWELVEPALKPDEARMLIEPLRDRPGTVVLWQRLNATRRAATERGSRSQALVEPGWGSQIAQLKLHLGMTFHRFLTGETRERRQVRIRVNEQEVEPWDPFERSNPATEAYDAFAELIAARGGQPYPVTVLPYLLPHKNQFPSVESWKRAGYDGAWNERQGFYIYRADRLIQAGGWSGLWERDEHTKLARVAVLFDPELDDLFDINTSKMSVSLPPQLEDALREQLKALRAAARKRYGSEGKRASNQESAGAGKAGAASTGASTGETGARPEPAASEARAEDRTRPGGGTASPSDAPPPTPPPTTGRSATPDPSPHRTPPGQPAGGTAGRSPEPPPPASSGNSAPSDLEERLREMRLEPQLLSGAVVWETDVDLADRRVVRLNRAHPLGRALVGDAAVGPQVGRALAALIRAMETVGKDRGLAPAELQQAILDAIQGGR